VSIKSVAEFVRMDYGRLNDYYKNHLSGFHQWNQKAHAGDFILFRDNVGPHLAIDETSLSNGELYTVVTNKDGHGGKGTLVAMVRGVQSDYVIQKLRRLPAGKRAQVKSITMDMSNSMYNIARRCFHNAEQIVDRFHVQKLMYYALQELRIKHRWEMMAEGNRLRDLYRTQSLRYSPEIFPNGETMRQLMARCARLLVRKPGEWSQTQRERAEILFERMPDMKAFYYLALRLGKIYSDYNDKDVTRPKLALWFNDIERWHLDEFDTVIKTFKNHYERILNYFNNESTNASAESFNCKLKNFRAEFRGVNDLKFYLYRVKQLYS
jgi:transposase